MRRTLLVGLSVFAMLTLNVALANAASVRTGVIHAMKVNKPAHHKGGGGGVLLASHGGAIEQTPSGYIIYRGPQWGSGFTPGAHTRAEAQWDAQGVVGQFWRGNSSSRASYGPVSSSNMPYQPDAGAACGQDFVNSDGYFDGFSIVGGHEYAETVTDPFPSTGWVDGAGAENGDKCAWISSGQGAAQNVTLSGGVSYPVQSLWSNAFNGGAGGCVVSYP